MARVTEAHVDARKAQILDAAWDCFARRGYHQTTMQDIAGTAGISAGAIYRYFPGKEAVLGAINARLREQRKQIVTQVRASTDDPLAVLRTIGGYMMAAFTHPGFETDARINMEIWPEVIRNRKLKEDLQDDLAYWREVVTTLLAAAQKRGEIPEHTKPESLVILFICAYEGLRHYALVDPEHFSVERLAEAMWTLFGTDNVGDLEELLGGLGARTQNGGS